VVAEDHTEPRAKRPKEASKMRGVLRVTFAIVAIVILTRVVVRAAGGWQRIEAEAQPVFLSGPVGRLIARTYAPFWGWLYSLFARRLDLQPEDEVLDVACGSGVFLRKHASHVRRIAGLDQSEPMIEQALRENRDRVAAGTAEFVVGDATALPWADDSFSAVTCNCVDCFEAKAEPALAEMYRVLRPGGRAVVADDRHEAMVAAGFSRVSAERVGWAHVTSGFKE